MWLPLIPWQHTCYISNTMDFKCKILSFHVMVNILIMVYRYWFSTDNAIIGLILIQMIGQSLQMSMIIIWYCKTNYEPFKEYMWHFRGVFGCYLASHGGGLLLQHHVTLQKVMTLGNSRIMYWKLNLSINGSKNPKISVNQGTTTICISLSWYSFLYWRTHMWQLNLLF